TALLAAGAAGLSAAQQSAEGCTKTCTVKARTIGAEQTLAHFLQLAIGLIGIFQNAAHLRIDPRLRPRAVDDDGDTEADRLVRAAVAFGGHHEFRLDAES